MAMLHFRRQRVGVVFRRAVLFEIEHRSQHLLNIGRGDFADGFREFQNDVGASRRVGVAARKGSHAAADADLHVVLPRSLNS